MSHRGSGPEAVDREQLDLPVELIRDVGDYSEDSSVVNALKQGGSGANSAAQRT
jgi:hypothetical protein